MAGDLGGGIWIPRATGVDDDTEYESEEDESESSAHSQETSGFEPQSENEEEAVGMEVAGVGRFGALVLYSGSEDEEDKGPEDKDMKSEP
jgi:hypothetical protein